MHDDETWRYIDEQRAELADFLEQLLPQQWSTPSLCDRWTVRDVAAHVTQSTAPWLRFGVEMVRSGFRFDPMVSRLARQDTRSPDELVTALRAMVGVRRHPPMTTVADPLMDVLVHTQDIARPLGLARAMPVVPAAAVAERVWGIGFPFHAQRRFAGVELVADDVAFRVGSGSQVTGAIGDIVLALSGRTEALARLSGPIPAAAHGQQE